MILEKILGKLKNTIPHLVVFPKLTIITPSFNQGEFIEETILSVLNQNYANLEFIIIDGGSTDNTLNIIKKYERKLAYWVSEPDKGQSHAINKGLARATGDIIGWINSDDVYVRGAFKKVTKAFFKFPEAILVHGDRILLDQHSNVYGWGVQTYFDPQRTGFNVCSETAFWRAAMVDNISINENLKFAMDLEFFCRLYKIGKFVKLNSYLGYFRAQENSKSSTIAEIGRQEAEREWKKIFGNKHDGWKIGYKPSISNKIKLIYKFVSNPILVAFPYIFRRIVLRRRGI